MDMSGRAADPESETGPAAVGRADERRAFIILAVLLAPVLAVALVGGYGFIIWMIHLIYGPPTG